MLFRSTDTRTLVSAEGPRQYRFAAAFWAPGGQWIAADDGRILVVTVGESADVRVLTAESGAIAFGGDDGRMSRFAVTGADLLTPAP